MHGSVNAQYTQKVSCTTGLAFQFSDGSAKRAAKNVAGKKAMVMMATDFIDELSREVALASLMLATALSRVIFWVIC